MRQRGAADLVLVDQLAGLFVDQQLARLADLQLARLAPGLAHLREQALELLGHLFHALRAQDLERRLGVGHLEFDFLVVERAFAQALAHDLACGVVGGGGASAATPAVATDRGGGTSRSRMRSSAASSASARLLAHLALALLLHRHVEQVAHDGVDVLADVAHLGELGRFDLDEGRIGQPRQPARDLGLAHAGGADHQDVLRRDLAAQLLVDLLAPPAVAQRNGHRALGLVLADDVAVEFGDDLRRRHGLTTHHRASTVWFWLV
jgi:hypothetical protein